MIIHANFLTHLWPEAIAAAVYITNWLLTKAFKDKIPYKAWYNEQSNLSNLRIYNCDAYVIDYQAKLKKKMALQSCVGTLVGYEVKNQ